MTENRDVLHWLPVSESAPNPMSHIEVQFLMEQVQALSGDKELLVEELNSIVGRMTDATDAGWIEMTSGASQSGLQLRVLKEVASRLRDMTDTNPMLKRGHQLRRDYVYARGMDLGKIQPRFLAKINDPFNYEALFCEEGHDAIMKARYTDGNRFALVNKSSGKTILVPLDQISNSITDADDPSRILYFERTINTKPTWYASDLYDAKAKSTIQVSGKTFAVDRKSVMVHKAYNRPVGATWGLPDALAAYLWVIAYSNYLKDNASLTKALSRIAIKISAGSKASGNAAASAMGQAKGAGDTAIFGSDVRVDAMSNTGSGVNFNNGRPLAAYVATSLGVSIVALLSDPGTGGSYGVAETLDPPTLLLAQTLQTSETEFYSRILTIYGVKDAQIKFPSIDKDPVYRQIQALLASVAQGLLSRKEVRPVIATLMDIADIKPGELPEADGFNKWTDPDPKVPEPAAPMNDPTPRQGNSGAAGSVDQGTNNDGATVRK